MKCSECGTKENLSKHHIDLKENRKKGIEYPKVILCRDDEKVKQDTKITIISEKLNTHPRCKENSK